jgi:hypothetical protein
MGTDGTVEGRTGMTVAVMIFPRPVARPTRTRRSDVTGIMDGVTASPWNRYMPEREEGMLETGR